MRRGYFVYFAMFVALGVGMWGVLRLGSALQAPADIAGTWAVRWETPSPTGSGYHGTMTIDQSGRFCTFRFDGTRSMSLKILDGTVLGRGEPRQPMAILSGGGYQMRLLPTEVRGSMRLEISGRDHYRGLAERRTPARAAASPGSTPHATPPVADARP